MPTAWKNVLDKKIEYLQNNFSRSEALFNKIVEIPKNLSLFIINY